MVKTVAKHFKTGRPEEDYHAWTARLRREEDRPRVAWNNQWLPPNWGWESEKAAFRFYLGHFDLFGKRQWIDTLIMPKIAEGKSYHIDQNGWGMDILHVGGKTAGCGGGVILYVNGVPYPVRNETGKGAPPFLAAGWWRKHTIGSSLNSWRKGSALKTPPLHSTAASFNRRRGGSLFIGGSDGGWRRSRR